MVAERERENVAYGEAAQVSGGGDVRVLPHGEFGRHRKPLSMGRRT